MIELEYLVEVGRLAVDAGTIITAIQWRGCVKRR